MHAMPWDLLNAGRARKLGVRKVRICGVDNESEIGSWRGNSSSLLFLSGDVRISRVCETWSCPWT